MVALPDPLPSEPDALRAIIAVQAADSPALSGAAIDARFLASEYSGATVSFFFEIDGGQVIEVEHHLSHRSPDRLEAQAAYRLSWRAEDGIVFA